MLLPFTHLVALGTPYAMPDYLSVKGSGKLPIMASIGETIGSCMDPFNPNIAVEYFKPLFKNFFTSNVNLWLDRNTPMISKTDQIDSNATNPFYNLPFTPGSAKLSENTLPDFGVHTLDAGKTDYHFNLHSIYGHQLAK
jgi:hypothetical protein